jgi:radical SAM protein with 4Fe4S-binding SPASM domain
MHTLYNMTPRERFCSIFTGGSLTITPNGNIYPCYQYVSDAHCVGTVTKGFRAAPRDFFADPSDFQDCLSCKVRRVCGGGGCFGRSFNHNGEITNLYRSFCERMDYAVRACIYALSLIQDDDRDCLFGSS